MALTTRCPQCGTAFKVVADQLKVRDGLVRCGVCASVFDGCSTLVADIPTLQVQPRAEPPLSFVAPSRAVPPRSSADVFRTRQRGMQPAALHRTEPRLTSGDSPSTPVSSPEPAAAPEVLRGRHHALRRADFMLHDAEETDDDSHDDVHAHADAQDVLGESRMRYVDDYHTGRAPPEFLDEGRTQQRARWGRLWGWACVAAAVALVGLSAHVYRVQWSTQMPALRPLLQWMCTPLQCTVGYERRIERISILSSSLRPPPGGASAPGEQDLVLTAVLRNRFNAPQHWPALALELKDLSDTVMVRKTLLPRDYLPVDVLAQPFGPNAERKIVLPFRVRDVQVNGYQLDRFFL